MRAAIYDWSADPSASDVLQLFTPFCWLMAPRSQGNWRVALPLGDRALTVVSTTPTEPALTAKGPVASARSGGRPGGTRWFRT